MSAPSIRRLIADGYLQPWFLGYALYGLVLSGIVPILIPLSAESKGPIAVGFVVAAFYLGMLTAPFIGPIADRTGHQRLFFIASFPVVGAAAIGFGMAHQLWAMLLWIFVAGVGTGAGQTMANVFIVEGRPRREWPDRTGWMRLAFGIGQVIGLAVAAFFSARLELGWTLVGILMFVGALLGAIRLPKFTADPAPATSDNAGRPGKLAQLRTTLFSPFGVALGFWLFSMIGLMAFYNVVPLVLKAAFATSPSTTSLYFLVGSAIGAIIYPLCGPLADRIGSAMVLALGCGVTLVAFVVLSIATLSDHPGSPIGGLCLVAMAVVFPLMYIGANLQAAELATGKQGFAMGLFNSGFAGGALIGALVPAFLARAAGYDSLPWFSLGAMIIAAVLAAMLVVHHRKERAGAFDTAGP